MSFTKSQPPVLHNDVRYDEDDLYEFMCLSLMLNEEDIHRLGKYMRMSELDADLLRTLLDKGNRKNNLIRWLILRQSETSFEVSTRGPAEMTRSREKVEMDTEREIKTPMSFTREFQLNDMIRTLLDEYDRKSTFLQTACLVPQRKNMVEFLLAYGADPNRTTRGNESPPLVIAAEQQNYDVMGMLLDAGVDVNLKDGNGNTALHVVANDRNLGMVVRLLNAGARLDIKNNRSQEPIPTELLMNLMDMSLQAEETTLPYLDMHRIKIDFGLFIQRQSSEVLTRGPAEVSNICSESVRLCYFTEIYKENCILTHPLVTTFLHLKWSIISRFYYANLVWVTMFTVLLNVFIVMASDKERLSSNILLMILKVPITILWFGIVFREFLQFLQDFRRYICNVENILVVAVIVCTVLSMFVKWDHEDMRLTFSLLTALLSWLELFVFSGKIPALSDYLEISKMVVRNYSVFLTRYWMQFATIVLAFYLVGRTSGEIFPAVEHALFTMKMLHVNTLLLVSNLVLFIFVFVGIVQLNVLYSLATKGFLKIKATASLLSVRSRLRLVRDIENSLMITRTLGIPLVSRKFSVNETMIFPEGCCDNSAYIYPNHNPVVAIGERILSVDRDIISEAMKIAAASKGAKKAK